MNNNTPSHVVPGLTNAEDASIELNATVIELVRDLVYGKPGAFIRGLAFLDAVDEACRG
jgi:hypothetical protein